MTEAGEEAASARRAFAVAAFNGAWDLIDKADRTPDEDKQMLTLAFASRWHWSEIGTAENHVIADWQVAHVASLVDDAPLALSFAQAAYDIARSAGLPDWTQASTAEGLARAHACAGDKASYEKYEDEEDRELILGQLASIR
jgi:hypothetical protein